MADIPADLNGEIKRVIVEALNLDTSADQIQDDAPLFGDGLGLDSIDALEIAMAIEKRFGIKVQPDKETKKYFFSIATLADLVRQRLAGTV
jgi:acyl carrier protein